MESGKENSSGASFWLIILQCIPEMRTSTVNMYQLLPLLVMLIMIKCRKGGHAKTKRPICISIFIPASFVGVQLVEEGRVIYVNFSRAYTNNRTYKRITISIGLDLSEGKALSAFMKLTLYRISDAIRGS